MKTVQEVSRLTGVSVRTLHHYDAIGLLAPTQRTPAGYRLYDDATLARLQAILLLRQLRFPLAKIREILDRPGFDVQQALRDQLRLLAIQRKQLDQRISLARTLLQNGGNIMDDFTMDTTSYDAFAAEAKARWGNTAAYRESRAAQAARSPAESAAVNDGLMAIFAEFGAIKHGSADSCAAQDTVARLRSYISAHYYRCTPEILAGLGQLYCADERFRANIDRAGGAGTAAFAAQAIQTYCSCHTA